MGNTPQCFECFYYAEKEPNDGCLMDGWCTCPHQLKYGANGHKRAIPLKRMNTRANYECGWWEDAETRDSHFDVVTGKVRQKFVRCYGADGEEYHPCGSAYKFNGLYYCVDGGMLKNYGGKCAGALPPDQDEQLKLW